MDRLITLQGGPLDGGEFDPDTPSPGLPLPNAIGVESYDKTKRHWYRVQPCGKVAVFDQTRPIEKFTPHPPKGEGR